MLSYITRKTAEDENSAVFLHQLLNRDMQITNVIPEIYMLREQPELLFLILSSLLIRK
jgi:hypothetical protein